MRREVGLIGVSVLLSACLDLPDDGVEGRYKCTDSADCISGFTCSGGFCMRAAAPQQDGSVDPSCTPRSHDHLGCSDGDVYYFDSCGGREQRVTNCNGRGCSGNSCSIPSADGGAGCTSHASQACSNGDVYWYDSCGAREGLATSCSGNGCTAGACSPPPSCPLDIAWIAVNGHTYATSIPKGRQSYVQVRAQSRFQGPSTIFGCEPATSSANASNIQPDMGCCGCSNCMNGGDFSATFFNVMISSSAQSSSAITFTVTCRISGSSCRPSVDFDLAVE